MNFHRTIVTSLIGLALAGTVSTAFGAAAVAVGSSGYSHTVLEADDLEQAKARALAACEKNDRDCTVTVWTARPAAIALAKSPGGTTSVVRDTPEAARDAAMQMCRESYKECKFAAVYWEPGGYWAAWATAESGNELLAQYFAYQYDSEEGAREEALAGCRKNLQALEAARAGGATCKVATRRGAWTRAVAETGSMTFTKVAAAPGAARMQALASCGKYVKQAGQCRLAKLERNEEGRAQPASFDKVFAQTSLAKERREAAPRKAVQRTSNALTCTNRCVNGSCLRTFANGRTERWQAPRVLDPFTNDWKWDTSSCGG